MDYSNLLGGGVNRLYVFINGEDVTPTTLYTRAPGGLSKDHFRVVSSGNGTIYVDNFMIYRPGQAESVIGVSQYSVWESLDSSLAKHKLPLTAEFGSAISWTSDDAITINADGSFETALKSVALTATISMGEATPAATTKTVTVPKKGTLGTGDNWCYDGFDTDDDFGNWTNVKNAIVSDGVLSVVGAGSQANFVSPKTWSGTIIFESRVKYDENSWASGETLLFVKSGGGGGFNIIVNKNGEVVIKTSSSKVADSARKDVVLCKTVNQWFDLKWIVDFNNNGKISAFIDGVEIDPDSLGYSRADASAYKADAVLLDTKIVTGATGGVYIDEVMVYNDTWMDTVGVTKAGLKVSEEALTFRQLPTTGRNNSSITWSSSTTGVTVGADGSIDAPLGTDTAAVLTATISAGDYSETKEFNVTIPKFVPYAFAVSELDTSTRTMIVSVQNRTKTAITPAIIAAVYDGTKLVEVVSDVVTPVDGTSSDKLPFTFVKELKSGYVVKLFTWDSISGMQPFGAYIPVSVIS